jgi:hypothetical protein
MIQQDYIMLIMNCKKYMKKAKFQKMTWLPRIPNFIKYYHVIGDPELEIEYTFDNDNNILWVKVEDDYNSLPKKVIRAYKAINDTFEFKYLFKTDDDQILVNEKFFNVIVGITNSVKKIHYGGYIVDVKQNYLSQYNKIHPELPNYLPILKTKYCSGRFYFLSSQAIVNLINKKDLIEKEYLEDYAIGYNLDSIYKNTIINIATNNYFTDIENSDFQKMLDKGAI